MKRFFYSFPIGRALMRDALLKTIETTDIIGGRAVLVHAKDVRVKKFYEDIGFETSPIEPLNLFLLIKNIKKSIGL